ncbi:MAG: HAMP domain-containing sensor histidine kinase [Cyclobacteriaceae bacterium]
MKFNRSIFFLIPGLFLIAIGFLVSETSESDEAEILTQITQRLTEEVNKIDGEAVTLLAQDTIDLSQVSHSFFLMDSINVLDWNKNEFLPDIHTVQGDFSVRLLQWPRGIFLLRKWQLGTNKFLLGVLPLQNRYKINNRYLISGWDKKIFPTNDIVINDPSGSGQPFVVDGKEVFKFSLADSVQAVTGVNTNMLWIVFLGLLFLIIAVYQIVVSLQAKGRFGFSFLIVLVFFVGGRSLMLVLFSSPDIPLFDPAYFASSSYNRSVGDLLLNTICIAIPIVYLFLNYHQLKITRRVLEFQHIRRKIAVIVLLLLCYFSILLPYLFIETIFHNSSIALDITQTLSFNSVRIFSFLSIVIGFICGFMLVHVFARLAMGLIGKKRVDFYLLLGITFLIFFAFSLITQRGYWIPLIVSTTYLIIICAMKLPRNLIRTSYASFIYIFVAIIAFSLLGSLSVKKFVLEEKVNAQFRFANAFLTDRDYLGEYLLGESVQRISSDPFVQTRLGSPFLSKAVVRQKVKQVYLNAYFDRYDIQIHLFNSTGNTYDNSTDLNFTELITKFQQEASKTNYEGVFFLKNATPESTKRYLVVIPISRFNMVTGYVVLDLSLKRVIPRNLFPELLLDDRFIQYFKNRDFSYAFYSNNQITSSFGDFNFEKDFPIDQLSNSNLLEDGVTENNFIHVGVEDEQGEITVVSSPAYSDFYVVTNFSFLFIIGLFIILIGLLIYGAKTFFQRRELNYSARIQLYVYLAFVLPLLMVSATTLGLISNSAETQLKEEYKEKSKTIGQRFTPLLDDYKNDSLASLNDLENQLIDLAKLANVDATVFLPTGKLLASSQPLIYEDRILPSLVNREAMEAIVYGSEQSFVNNELIGTLRYNSSYYAMRSPDTGNLLGILSLPFFESAYSLEKTQIRVMANIITIFCIVFILFSFLSFFAMRWLTFPLEFITRTLRSTSLTASNKPLEWKSNDEIGLMVNEYNKMVDNLEQSKIEISRIQKESAWREIAKQVAHEVKNPLTPMKLTLQQMERSLLTTGLSEEKTKKSIHTLLQQVEILNDIAASFSAFARMPAPILQRVDISVLVKRVVHLHADYKEGEIALSLPDQPVYVMGDDQLLSRVFSNIILNALQSRVDDKRIHILVSVKFTRDTCVVSFKDDGAGIDKELGDKVFLPHFSTKKSGSGLGLAIAKQGIEQSGGTIRFETGEGAGTTFYIELPKAD